MSAVTSVCLEKEHINTHSCAAFGNIRIFMRFDMVLNVPPHLVWPWHWRNLLPEPRPRSPSPQTRTDPQSAERQRRDCANQVSITRRWPSSGDDLCPSHTTETFRSRIQRSCFDFCFLKDNVNISWDLYPAQFKCLAVLSFHLATVIFGMCYQTPVKCIVCPCGEEKQQRFNESVQQTKLLMHLIKIYQMRIISRWKIWIS